MDTIFTLGLMMFRILLMDFYDVEGIIDGFHFEMFIVDKLIKISQNEKIRKYLISFIISAEMTSFYLPDKG